MLGLCASRLRPPSLSKIIAPVFAAQRRLVADPGAPGPGAISRFFTEKNRSSQTGNFVRVQHTAD